MGESMDDKRLRFLQLNDVFLFLLLSLATGDIQLRFIAEPEAFFISWDGDFVNYSLLYITVMEPPNNKQMWDARGRNLCEAILLSILPGIFLLYNLKHYTRI